jgi:amidophosphoribosyltransferase
MKALLEEMRRRGGAREIHVRVACPPIVAPCFYGIDMSTVGELFAPRYMRGLRPTLEELRQMAAELGADSLLYLPIEAVARCIGMEANRLCQACITGRYPTPTGDRLYQLALKNAGLSTRRTYELAESVQAPAAG